jgi:hypothetical protein
VRTGVTLLLVSIILVILMVIVVFIGSILVGVMGARAVQQQGAAPQAGDAAATMGGVVVVAIIGGVMMLIAVVVSLVGQIFCLAAPPKYGAKTLAIVTLILAVLSFLLTGVGEVAGMVGGMGAAANQAAMAGGRLLTIVGQIGRLTSLAQLFVFLFFLKAVARCIRADGLERSVKSLIILFAVMVVGFLVVMLVSMLAVAGVMAGGAGGGGKDVEAPAAAMAGVGILVLVCGCAEGLLALAGFIWYIIVLVQTRMALGDYLGLR